MAKQNGIRRAPRVFGDTASWIALLNKDDALHARALEVRRELRQRKVRVVTTEFVLIEVADGLSDPPLRKAVIAFIEEMRREPTIEIVPLSEQLMASGWALYQQRPDKEWGLTDCISFVVMQEQGIDEAFTSDHHFTQAGFTILLSHKP